MTDAIQPPRSRKPLLWIALGCLVLTIGAFAVVGVIGAIVAGVFGAIRSSSPYTDALARARADERVIAILGTPVEPGWFVSGSVHTENQEGKADLDIPLTGPRGKATLHVTGTKRLGEWSYTEMTVTPKAGDSIDLLTSSERPVGRDLPAL